MKKLIWGLVIVVVVAVFGGRAWWLYQHKETGDNVVKVGILSFTSGQYAKMGQDLVNGIILAKEELANTKDGVKLQLFVEDGKAIAKDSINAFNKLLFHNVDSTIIAGDIQVPPVAPLVAEHKIPTVMTIMGNTGYLKYNQGHLMYQIWPSNYGTSYAIGEYAKNDLKLNNVAIIKMGSIYGQDGAKGFIDALGQKPVIEEEFKPDATDLRPLVLKVLDTKPNAIFVTGHGKAYNAVINHIKEYRFDGPILTGSEINDIQSVENIKDMDGVIFAEAKDFTSSPQFLEFAKRYEKRFGEKPALESAFGYDAIRLLNEAIKRNPSDIRAGLESIKEFDTFSGKMKLMEDGSSIFHLSIKQMLADKTEKTVKE